jgi:adenylyl-sulfate reductase (glutathione)
MTEKECGLHSGNIQKADGTSEARKADRDLWIDSPVVALNKAQLQGLADGKRDKDTLIVLYAPWCPFCQAMEAAYTELGNQLAGSSVRVAKYQADVDKEFCTEKLGLKTFPTVVYLPKGREGFIKYPSERRDVDTLRM